MQKVRLGGAFIRLAKRRVKENLHHNRTLDTPLPYRYNEAMSKPPKDPPERKSVTMPRSMWRDIAKFQTADRIATEAEALRRVVVAGLRSLTQKDQTS
jgi:hypothetical protein